MDPDIRGFFDNIPKDLLLRAVKNHATEPWMVLYIERWLNAPLGEEDGELVAREKGTPQGGVMRPADPPGRLRSHYGPMLYQRRLPHGILPATSAFMECCAAFASQ